MAPNRPVLVSHTVLLCLLSALLVDIGSYAIRAPYARSLERIICQDYWQREDPYFNGDVDEKACKVASVQTSLAMLQAGDLFFSCLPAIALSLPMGILSDRYGRKLPLVIALTGLTLATLWMQFVVYLDGAIDLKWYWMGNAFLLLGGGPTVINNMYFTILSDVSSERRRTPKFLQLMAINLAGSIIAIPSAWYFSRSNNWLPLLLGVFCIILGSFISLMIPETLYAEKQMDPDRAPLLRPEEAEATDHNVQDIQISTRKDLLILQLAHQLYLLFASPLLLILSLTFFVNSLGQNVLTLLIQYASNRYDMTLTEASLIIPIFSAIKLFLFVFILPRFDQSAGGSFKANIILLRMSILLTTSGFLGIALATNITAFVLSITILAFGAAYPAMSRSLVTSFVTPDQVGALYAALSIIDTSGTLASGPILSSLFSLGLRHGTMWEGLPFIFVAGLFASTAVVVCTIRTPTGEREITEQS